MPEPGEILWVEWAEPQTVLLWTDGLHGFAGIYPVNTQRKVAEGKAWTQSDRGFPQRDSRVPPRQ